MIWKYMVTYLFTVIMNTIMVFGKHIRHTTNEHMAPTCPPRCTVESMSLADAEDVSDASSLTHSMVVVVVDEHALPGHL